MSSFSHIKWAFNVSNWKPTFEQWKLAVQCVQKEETERCYRFVFVEDCKSSMVGRLLMRKAVAEGTGQPYDKILFSRTSSGKPFLEGNSKFSFNVSHHGDFCVLAADPNLNVGVDVMKVEYKGPTLKYFSLMKKQFSSYEWDFMMQPGPEKEKLRRFFRLWCLKESYVKAIGTGITIDLASISFACPTLNLKQDIVTTDTKLYKEGHLQSEWKFEETFLDEDHCAAVAYVQQSSLDLVLDNSSHFKHLTFEDLIQGCKPFETEKEDFWEAFKSKCIKARNT